MHDKNIILLFAFEMKISNVSPEMLRDLGIQGLYQKGLVSNNKVGVHENSCVYLPYID